MCCPCVSAVGPFIFTREWWWLICLFIPLQAEVRVGLNKTLAKHPGETMNSMESSWQFIFFPYLTSNCLDSKYDGGRYGKEDRDSFLQKSIGVLRQQQPSKVCEPYSRVSKYLIAVWSSLARAPAWVQMVCTAWVCMSGQTSSWDRSRSCTLLSSALQLLLGDFGQATLCLSFPNCKMEDTSLC